MTEKFDMFSWDGIIQSELSGGLVQNCSNSSAGVTAVLH